MNNINNSDHIKSNKKSSSRRKLGYALMLTGLLSSSSPAEAKTLNTIDNNGQSLEVVDNSNILNNIERRTWIALSGEYANKLKNFVVTNKVMKSNNWAKFTENFIVNQMKSNWWISKENQLVFVWSAVYKQITDNDLYDWSDWDDDRLDEFSNVIDNIEQCWNEYVIWFNSYMKRASADAQQRSADADREIIRGTNSRLNNLVKFYNLYKNNPSSIKQNEINHMMRSAKEIVQDCKEYGIDYKAKLPIEVRRFYGID